MAPASSYSSQCCCGHPCNRVDAVGKLDPAFGYADNFDEAAGKYAGLAWAKSAPESFPPTAVFVRSEVAAAQVSPMLLTANALAGAAKDSNEVPGLATDSGAPASAHRPRRFFGAVELDMVRPVKVFDAVLNAVVMELQRTHGAKVKVTIEIEAEAGFDEADIGVVPDNARQLKFKVDSTGFE